MTGLDPAAKPVIMAVMTMIRTPFLLLSLSLATPSFAQAPPSPNLTADRTQIATCLRQSGAANSACIGLVAVACVGSTGVDRRAAEPTCARREEAVWRERLGQALRLVARSLDEGQRSKLASVQLAWEGYAVQKCAFYGSVQRDGLQIGRQAGCELREVASRALELERALPQANAPRRPQTPPQIYR